MNLNPYKKNYIKGNFFSSQEKLELVRHCNIIKNKNKVREYDTDVSKSHTFIRIKIYKKYKVYFKIPSTHFFV